MPTAFRPDPQSRLIVVPGTSAGSPASSDAMRATLRLSSPAWLAQPRMASSTAPQSIVGLRRTSSAIGTAARSSARTDDSDPLSLPIGVLIASQMKAFGMPASILEERKDCASELVGSLQRGEMGGVQFDVGGTANPGENMLAMALKWRGDVPSARHDQGWAADFAKLFAQRHVADRRGTAAISLGRHSEEC